ncbi:hypothetical protein [Streptomyces sp. NPDC051001]|uniref:hypothetical protein n=1 Tax=Streptomyces sp. NPDC051001 TaxID=3155795 RepID=UPI00342EE7DE
MAARPALVLEGEPGEVKGLVPWQPSIRRSVQVSVEGLEPGSIRVLTAPMGDGHTEIRLLMAAGTPPGEYPARLVSAEGSLNARVRVRSCARVRVHPADLLVEGVPGADVPVTVYLLNEGNVPADPGRVGVVALEEEDAVERAIVAGLMGEARSVERFGTAADVIAAAQAGTVRVVAPGRPKSMPPGAGYALSVDFRLPEGLTPGRSYDGTWQVCGQPVPVRVTVTEQPRQQRTRSRGGSNDR